MAALEQKEPRPWKVRVRKVRFAERWLVASEIDLGHHVVKRNDSHPTLARANAAAELLRNELKAGRVPPAWMKTIDALKRPAPQKVVVEVKEQ